MLMLILRQQTRLEKKIDAYLQSMKKVKSEGASSVNIKLLPIGSLNAYEELKENLLQEDFRPIL